MKSKVFVNVFYEPCPEQAAYFAAYRGLYSTINVGNLKTRGLADIYETDFADNISELNPKLNELTAWWILYRHPELYGGCDYVGFNHYRQVFVPSRLSMLEYFGADALVSVPAPMVFNLAALTGGVTPKPVRCDVRDGYDICHKREAWDLFEEEARNTELSRSFDVWSSSGSMYAPCNMFVMRPALFREYCDIAFPILFRLEKRIDMTGYDNYQKRQVAFLSERLFSLFMFHKKNNGAVVIETDPMKRPEWKPVSAADKRGLYS